MEQASAWQRLQQHYKEVENLSLRTLFGQDEQRFERFSLSCQDLFLDYSKNRINAETVERLCAVAQSANLEAARADLFSGEKINWTENRAVLHTALRNRSGTPVLIDGHNIMENIAATLQQMAQFSTKFRNQELSCEPGKTLRNLVNIGIGGSHLGPEMMIQALHPYSEGGPEVRCIANIDASSFQEGVQGLDPHETLFVLASKTFTTRETLVNGHSAKRWLQQGGVAATAMDQHFAAITASPEKAQDFGVVSEQIFPLWDWVGGRYSWCSAIGLSVAVAIGFERFIQLLDGAHVMDNHFMQAPLAQNMPVLMAMIGIWNSHFLGAKTQAIIPYDHTLRRFPAFLQQCDMESSGKRVNRYGHTVTYPTGPILWGEQGSNSQHSFFQLLHQGTHLVPVDFIGFAQSHQPMQEHHLELMANFFAQSEALMWGRTEAEARLALEAEGVSAEEMQQRLPHCVFPGNQPSNMLLGSKLTPFNLGMLIALYEMKIFVQGVVWQINSFDQWGVELGKTLAERVLTESHAYLAGEEVDLSHHDGSTQGLLRRFLTMQHNSSTLKKHP